LWNTSELNGVNWKKAIEVGLGLLISPLIGFAFSAGLLLLMRMMLKNPRLYQSPQGDDRPPSWIRLILIATCGGVSFAHGSNDGQKGMGLILLVLIGFLPAHYALTVNSPDVAPQVCQAVSDLRTEYDKYQIPVSKELSKDFDFLQKELANKSSFDELSQDREARWEVRLAIQRTLAEIKKREKDPATPEELKVQLRTLREDHLSGAIEFIPLWVVVGTALALGIGTMIGYKRIVVTVAEKIGKSHLTYAQGAAAQTVTAATILVADLVHLPVSTTQVLSSGVAGSMAANGAGIQVATCRKILMAWIFTLPACALLGGALFTLGRLIAG
jgi:phosphate/sulfate permease